MKAQLNTTLTKKLRGLPSISAQIRHLTSLKWSRGDISRALTKVNGKFIRYQWVRNVQLTPVKTPKS